MKNFNIMETREIRIKMLDGVLINLFLFTDFASVIYYI